MKWTWRDLPGDPTRTIELDFNYWTGGKQLRIDGALVPTEAKLLGWWSHDIAIGERRATVRAKAKYLAIPDAELTVDGAVIAPSSGPRALPPWTWAFVIANLAILVAARGGAIPGAIAGVGAASAIGIARSAPSLGIRLVLATLVTGAAWGAFALLLRALTT